MIIPPKSLIVSCQAEDNDPFNSPKGVSLFAKAAEQGGAAGIRSEGIIKTEKIISKVTIPVIGLVKSKFEDNTVKITGKYKDVEDLLEIGCSIIAIDGTNRLREKLTGPEFIAIVKKKYGCPVLADIATLEEAVACQDFGADYISSTLNGYTHDTINDNNDLPNFFLVNQLVSNLEVPVFAEGRISTIAHAKKMIDLGVKGVIIGTYITRPRIITKNFVNIITS